MDSKTTRALMGRSPILIVTVLPNGGSGRCTGGGQACFLAARAATRGALTSAVVVRLARTSWNVVSSYAAVIRSFRSASIGSRAPDGHRLGDVREDQFDR